MDSDSASRRRSERARQTRDEEVEAILQAAGMPGLRVLTGGMDDSREDAGNGFAAFALKKQARKMRDCC